MAVPGILPSKGARAAPVHPQRLTDRVQQQDPCGTNRHPCFQNVLDTETLRSDAPHEHGVNYRTEHAPRAAKRTPLAPTNTYSAEARPHAPGGPTNTAPRRWSPTALPPPPLPPPPDLLPFGTHSGGASPGPLAHCGARLSDPGVRSSWH